MGLLTIEERKEEFKSQMKSMKQKNDFDEDVKIREVLSKQ